jgi:hypothetical protein
VATLEKDKTMAETADKKQGNSDAEEAGKTTRATKPAKPAKSVEPEAAPQLTNLLEGFTPDEVAALVRTKEAIEKGLYSDITYEHKKLLFVKWLVAHDKLAS